MSDQWQYYPCSMGDDQAFIFVDVGIKESIDATAPKSLVKVRLTYRKTHPSGLPTNEQFETANNIEDCLQKFAEQGEGVYVGRVTVAGHRYFHFFSFTEEDAWTEFLKSLSNETGYELKVSVREDPDHKGYWDDLYPTEDDWQVIGDLRIIENLEKHGDDGSEPRKVDHWVYFGNQEAAQPFIEWAESNGFTHEVEDSHLGDDRRYCVRLSHLGTIKIGDISHHTIALRRKASELSGDYDGWETVIIEPTKQQPQQ